MPDSGHPNSVASLELALLRALCASVDIHALLERMASALPGYKWQNAEHAIVYEALCKVPARDRRPLREQLPAIVTRMGFPDVDWEDYFTPRAAPEPEILELFRKLAATAATRP